MRTTPGLFLDRKEKLQTDFYFQAMAVGSMQLMYMWQKKNLKKERLSMLAYLSKTCLTFIFN